MSFVDDAIRNLDIDGATEEAARARPWVRHLPLALGLLLIVGLLAVGLVQGGTGTRPAGGLRSGRPAPDFALTTFDGRTVRLGDYQGRPLVLNFWATWCPPCREEAPALKTVAEANADRVAFLGIDVRDKEANARRFLAEFDVPYANGMDTTDIELRYQGIGIPYTVFIASDGTIARTWTGPLNEQRLTAFVEELS